MTVEEAYTFFNAIPRIKRKLQALMDVGLSYITLGQSALTFSGGEAQRIKLAKELSKVATHNTLYVLDEPTTGLHFHDVKQLLDMLLRLRDEGNTVIVIEHNLDVIKCADYIIDLGPEGGSGGGTIIATGTPEQIAQTPGSFTGEFLRPILERAGTLMGAEAPAKRPRTKSAAKKAAPKKVAPKKVAPQAATPQKDAPQAAAEAAAPVKKSTRTKKTKSAAPAPEQA